MKSFDAGGPKVDYPGPRATPAVDDDVVVTIGPLGNVYCLDVKGDDHKLLWQKSMAADYGGRKPRWAFAASPLLYKGWVIIAPQGKVGLAALDKKTGKDVWTSEKIGEDGYASPMLATIDKVQQVVMVAGPDPSGEPPQAVVGADIKTGKILWRYEGWKCAFPIASPTIIGDGRIFITSVGGRPYNSNSAMFRPRLKDGAWSVEECFQTNDCQSQMPNAILYENHLYANSAKNGKGLICMDLDGNIKWSKPNVNDVGGELVIADGMIYMMDGRNGELDLVKASPDECKVLSRAVVMEKNQVWAPLAISDGKLLCRDQKRIKCFDISAKAEK